MDKYSGCNIVESVVKNENAVGKKVRKKHIGLIVRLIVAAAFIGLICFAAYAPLPFLSEVRAVLKSVFCYDVFGRESFGASAVFTKLFGGA